MKKCSRASKKYRQQSNEILTKLKQQENTAPVIGQSRFADVIRCYNQALSGSINDDERTSAYKNLGVLFAYQINSTSIESVNKNEFHYNLKECIMSYGDMPLNLVNITCFIRCSMLGPYDFSREHNKNERMVNSNVPSNQRFRLQMLCHVSHVICWRTFACFSFSC